MCDVHCILSNSVREIFKLDVGKYLNLKGKEKKNESLPIEYFVCRERYI